MADSRLGKPSKKSKMERTDKSFCASPEMLPEVHTSETYDKPPKKEKLSKQGVPMARATRPTKLIQNVAELIEYEGLEQVSQVVEGENVLHLVKNNHNTRNTHGFNVVLAQCQVVKLQECPRVRFSNGVTKIVKASSLFRRKTG